jgi:chromosome segregation ATPase
VFRHVRAPSNELSCSSTLRPQSVKNSVDDYLISVYDVNIHRQMQPSSSVRLAESPLDHQSLTATANVVEALAQCDDLRVRGPRSLRDMRGRPNAPSDSLDRLAAASFTASILSQLLQEALGGTCLTLAVVFVSPGDFAGSKATLQLAQSLTKIHNFPVTNSSTIQGIRWRHLAQLVALKSDLTRRRRASNRENPSPADAGDAGEIVEPQMVRVLEENRAMRGDRQKLLAAMSALKTKYRSLFDDEIEVRKELLACEQEKLALSRAFVQFQQEKTQQLQALDAAKFEVEHKLIDAERMVLEIQTDDSNKAAQIQELCGKLGELVKEKATIAEDLARVQTHARAQEQELDREARKNQQLSLELIVAVNQKTKLQAEREVMDAERRAGGGRLESVERELETLRVEHRELQARCASLESQADEARKDVVRKELELERLALANTTERLQREQATRSEDQQLSAQSDKLVSALEVERAAFAAERRALALQLERTLVESKQLAKDKEGLVAAWMAKANETEELRVRVERLSAEAQAQIELFRSKLARLYDGKAGADAGGRALEQLIQSFQSREKKLRSELERSEEDKLALLRRLHARSDLLSVVERRRLPTAAGDDTMADEDDEGAESVAEAESTEDLIDELGQMRERLAASEQRVIDEMDARASQALEMTELERKNAQLANECEQHEHRSRELEQSVDSLRRELEAGSRARDADAAAGIVKMHETLMRQVDEVRRLTLAAAQHQQRADGATNQADSGFASTSRDSTNRVASGRDQLKALLEENRQLTARLRDGKAQWVTALEETERRCAALLTKNVMLEEENQHLRQRVKVPCCRSRSSLG